MDITVFAQSLRKGLAANMRPLPVTEVEPGDTVYGWIEEDRDGDVRQVHFFEPFEVTDVSSWQGAACVWRTLGHEGGLGRKEFAPHVRVMVVTEVW